ncbi:MAG: DUF2339 domain-containing protein [Bacteroidota bacterium]|nr:DUF2339 domain-containing protein [Bacteroidota bacterium]
MEVFLVFLLLAFAVVVVVKVVDHSSQLQNIKWQIKNLPNLTRRIEELELELQQLKNPASSKEKEIIPFKVISAETKQTIITSPVILTDSPQPNISAKIFEEPKPSRTREEWESLIGGKLMNRIGSLALIIGVGFFLKYAFDNNWISETVRVLIGAAFGLISVVGGYLTNKRGFAIFAQGLVGAGISILYLSVYASYNFYHLVPQWAAFGLMFLITAFTFANGLFYDSLAVALLGWAGGFLTPILLSSGEANEIGLFSYISILDIGLVALIVKKRRWNILEPLTFIGTWLMFFAWYQEYYAKQDLFLTAFFVSLFWGIFLFLDIYRSKSSVSTEIINHIVPGLNILIYYSVVYLIVNEQYHQWMSTITIAIGGVYLLMFLSFHRSGTLTEIIRIRYTLTSVILLVLATSIQFDDFNTVICWSIEAALLIFYAVRWKLAYLRQAALVLFGIGVFKLLLFTKGAYGYIPLDEFLLIVNQRAASFVILAGCLLYSAVTLKKLGEHKQNEISIVHFIWIAIIFLLLTIETNDFYQLKELRGGDVEKVSLEFTRMIVFSVVWMVYSIVLIWFGLLKKIIPMVLSGLFIASIGALFGSIKGIAFDPVEQFTFILNIRFFSLVLLVIGLAIHSKMFRSSEVLLEWKDDIVNIINVAAVILVLVLLTGETRDYFQKDIVSTTDKSNLVNLQQLSISGIWLTYSVILMSFGIWRRLRGLRFVAIFVFGITILKIFIYDLSFLETLFRIFSFMGLGFILLAVSFVYQKFKDIILGKN